MTDMPKCINCAHCDFIHEYETYFCNAAQHPIRDEHVDKEASCGFYEEKEEENDGS